VFINRESLQTVDDLGTDVRELESLNMQGFAGVVFFKTWRKSK